MVKTYGPSFGPLNKKLRSEWLRYLFPATGIGLYAIFDTFHLLLGIFGHLVNIFYFADPDSFWPRAILQKFHLNSHENLHNGIESYRVFVGVFLESTCQGVFTIYLLSQDFFEDDDRMVAVQSVAFSLGNVFLNLYFINLQAQKQNVGFVQYIFYRMQFPEVTLLYF